MAGPWFAVHRVGEGWKTLDKITISDGIKTDVAVVQTRVRFADDKGIYQGDGRNLEGFQFAEEVARVARK